MIIRGGKIIPGDGRTSFDNGFVLIREGRIIDVGPGPGPRVEHEETHEAHGRLVIPGIINSHAHACIPGPHVPTAGPARTLEQVREEHNRHLLAGETTVLHLCGFCLQEEVELIKDWPLHVEAGTSHLPSAIKAAQISDGRGLSKAHLACTARKRLAEGAAAIGEIGAGQLLGGGGADYQIIPQALEKATGVWLRPDQARGLKWAVLGKNLRREAFDPKKTSECLEALGLGAKLTASEAQTLLCDCVLPPLDAALKAFEEAAAVSAEMGKPAVVHNCPVAVPEIFRLAQKYPKARVIAGHSNQADFEIEEAVQWAKRLKEVGVIVDISTWDSPGKAHHADPKKFNAMLREGVADTVSTDYAGGEWEPVLKGLSMAVRDRALDMAPAIALATGNVARLLPQVANNRGLIARGRIADVVLVDENDIGNVLDVIAKGEFVVRNGKLCLPV